MSGPQFFETLMGRRWYEATAPKIADQLERLNGNLEMLVTELRLQREARATKEAAPQPTDQR
jgi:hypothetical protein